MLASYADCPARFWHDPVVSARIVHHGDGLAFLARGPLPADHAIITSLPDHSELPAPLPDDPTSATGGGRAAGWRGVDAWRAWFVETAAAVCRAVADDAVAIFYQTDVKHDGRWIDKSHLVACGVDAAGSHLLWHKIVCRVAPGTITFGRPAYAHILCASRARRLMPGDATADVLPELGAMSWSRAMGAAACTALVAFAAGIGARTIVDPFCGHGSVLAAANAHGLHAIGVELSRRRAAKARSLGR
jgi:hypothetical protein